MRERAVVRRRRRRVERGFVGCGDEVEDDGVFAS